MSPVTAADYKEVGGSFPAHPPFFPVTLLMFLIDLEEDEAAGGPVVLLLAFICFRCPYTIPFSLFSLCLCSFVALCCSKAKVSAPQTPCSASELIPGAAALPSD